MRSPRTASRIQPALLDVGLQKIDGRKESCTKSSSQWQSHWLPGCTAACRARSMGASLGRTCGSVDPDPGASVSELAAVAVWLCACCARARAVCSGPRPNVPRTPSRRAAAKNASASWPRSAALRARLLVHVRLSESVRASPAPAPSGAAGGAPRQRKATGCASGGELRHERRRGACACACVFSSRACVCLWACGVLSPRVHTQDEEAAMPAAVAAPGRTPSPAAAPAAPAVPPPPAAAAPAASTAESTSADDERFMEDTWGCARFVACAADSGCLSLGARVRSQRFGGDRRCGRGPGLRERRGAAAALAHHPRQARPFADRAARRRGGGWSRPGARSPRRTACVRRRT